MDFHASESLLRFQTIRPRVLIVNLSGHENWDDIPDSVLRETWAAGEMS